MSYNKRRDIHAAVADITGEDDPAAMARALYDYAVMQRAKTAAMIAYAPTWKRNGDLATIVAREPKIFTELGVVAAAELSDGEAQQAADEILAMKPDAFMREYWLSGRAVAMIVRPRRQDWS